MFHESEPFEVRGRVRKRVPPSIEKSEIALKTSSHAEQGPFSSTQFSQNAKGYEGFSDTDSIDSFYSYSARVDPPTDNSLLWDDDHEASSTAPFSAASSPQCNYHEKPVSAEIHRSDSASSATGAQLHNFHTSSLLLPVRDQVRELPARFHNEVDVKTIAGNRTESLNGSTNVLRDTLPLCHDAAVQTSPLIPVSPSLKMCQHCGADRYTFNLMDSREQDIALSLPMTDLSDVLPATLPTADPFTTLEPELSRVSRNDRDRPDHSFATSDALPDDVERLFDRALFSIQIDGMEGAHRSLSSIIKDPDGLQREFTALLLADGHGADVQEARTAGPTQSSPASADITSAPPCFSSPHGSMTTVLTSISGMTFMDPFAPRGGEISQRRQSVPPIPSVPPKGKSRPIRRHLSPNLQRQNDVPPVPVIPAAFLRSQYVVNSPRPKSIGDHPEWHTLGNLSDRLETLEDHGGASAVIRPHSPVQTVDRKSSHQLAGTSRLLRRRSNLVVKSGESRSLVHPRVRQTPANDLYIFQRRSPDLADTVLVASNCRTNRPSLWYRFFAPNSTAPVQATKGSQRSPPARRKNSQKLQRKAHSRSVATIQA